MARQSERPEPARVTSAAERRKAGRALREACARSSHGKVVLGQGAERDPVAIIEASNEDRMENLVPIRHGRMLQSPFAFFRGTAAIQAHDLAGTPSSGIVVQACGDCHLMNFGGFASPERNLVFDINDFDETLPAPFEWDLKRLAASFVVAARWRGFRDDQAQDIAVQSVASYREAMAEHAEDGVLEAWYAKIDVDDVRALAPYRRDRELAARVDKAVAKARKATHERVFNKLTTPHKGQWRIVDQPPLLYHADSQKLDEKVVATFFRGYRETLPDERRMLFDRYKVFDVAHKVVGVGSVGTRCLVALLMSAPNDPLFLQVKEARPSVLQQFTGGRVGHDGKRVVNGQRLMQCASDIFLGWAKGPAGRDYYVRQLRDMKASAEIENQDPKAMHAYALLCGKVLARAHARAGDAATIAGYLGNNDSFDTALGRYAVAYADQAERDYDGFARAVRAGKVKTDLSIGEIEVALR